MRFGGIERVNRRTERERPFFVISGTIVSLCPVKWGCWDSNPEPKDYESSALTVELQPHLCFFVEYWRFFVS